MAKRQCKCCTGLDTNFLQLMLDIQEGEIDIHDVDITQAEPFFSIFSHIFNEQLQRKQMSLALRNNNFMSQVATI